MEITGNYLLSGGGRQLLMDDWDDFDGGFIMFWFELGGYGVLVGVGVFIGWLVWG